MIDAKEFADAILAAFDNVKFIKTNEGFQVKTASYKTPKQKMLADPRFATTLQRADEFVTVMKSSKTLRNAVNKLLPFVKDERTHSRVCKELYNVLKTDLKNDMPNRTIHHGSTELLRHFEFSNQCSLFNIFFAPYQVKTDREEGTLTLDIPPFQPQVMLRQVSSATHFKLLSAGSEIDFINHQFNTEYHETKELLINFKLTDPIVHVHHIPRNSSLPLFLFLSIRYYNLINGEYHLLMNRKLNPLTIIGLDKI